MRVLQSLTIASTCAVLALTGCTASATSEAVPTLVTPSSAPKPTPTIPVGPVELTDDEAADLYLAIVCQRNIAMEALSDAVFAKEDEFLNGGTPAMTEIQAAAAEGLRIARASVELADDDYYTWPSDVAEHLKVVRDANLAASSNLSEIANADRFEDAYYSTWPNQDTAAAAAQEIRYQLGLDADTTASCEGHETATDDAHKEMTERREYLASFEDEDAD
ncbi:hypothetical protein P0L94_08140 [Microbacter sp. GSS18]|nr:hypothetical protein P0L94_08140 [Microbacter sp. GSS18]